MHIFNPYRYVSPWDGFGGFSQDFDGASYVDTNTLDFDGFFDSNHSFTFWAKFDDGEPADANTIIGMRTGNGVGDHGMTIQLQKVDAGRTGEMRWTYWDASTNCQMETEGYTNGDGLTAWVHYAVVIDWANDTGNIYVNGADATLRVGDPTNMTITPSFSGTTYNFFIGANNQFGTTNLYLNGKLADIRLYDTDLTSAQVTDLFEGKHVASNLYAWWVKDTDDWTDHSTNTYNGTESGGGGGITQSTDGPAD